MAERLALLLACAERLCTLALGEPEPEALPEELQLATEALTVAELLLSREGEAEEQPLLEGVAALLALREALLHTEAEADRLPQLTVGCAEALPETLLQAEAEGLWDWPEEAEAAPEAEELPEGAELTLAALLKEGDRVLLWLPVEQPEAVAD